MPVQTINIIADMIPTVQQIKITGQHITNTPTKTIDNVRLLNDIPSKAVIVTALQQA